MYIKFLRNISIFLTILSAIFCGSWSWASDLSIFQKPNPANIGSTLTMLLDTSGSMGDGTGYSLATNSAASDYAFGSTAATASCTKVNTYSSSTGKWTYNNTYSNTHDAAATSGYSLVLSVPAQTNVNGQSLPAFTLNYCPAPTAAIGQQCYLSTTYLTTVAPAATLDANAINGLSSVTSNSTTNGVSGVASTNGGIGTYCFDRISRLKLGMMGVLISNNSLLPNVWMGLAHFSTYKGTGTNPASFPPSTALTVTTSQADGSSGQVLVPAAALGSPAVSTTNQRYLLANAVAGLVAYNGTPTSLAYAEAAAYMLGTNTGSGSYSGFSYSVASSKSGSNYISPISNPANTTSCGQGIYVLSDGEPNSSSSTIPVGVMTSALGAYGTGFSCPTTGTYLSDTGSDGGKNDAGWPCIGYFSQLLNNPAKNSFNKPIKTAFVAFGTDFQNFVPGNTSSSSYYTDALNSCSWSSKSNSSDTCTATNATNNTVYGNGGFYFAQQPSQVTSSVIGFINTLSKSQISPLPAGAATVPVDNLAPNGFEPYAYLNALAPNPADPTVLVWNGNIKKFNISASGVVTDTSGTTTVFNSKGAYNNSKGTAVDSNGNTITIPVTKELWNQSSPSLADGGLVVPTSLVVPPATAATSYPAAGTFDKIQVPTTAKPAAPAIAATASTPAIPSTIRPVFTNVTTGGADLAAGSGLQAVPKASSSMSESYIRDQFANSDAVLKSLPLNMQLILLNYLGYNLPLATTTSLPATLTPPSTPFKVLGGTNHSTPIQLSYQGTLDSFGNLTSTRSEYLLYGSMEGAVHVVDATNTTGGGDVFTFIPREVLVNPITQNALIPNTSSTATAPAAVAPQTASYLPVPSQGVDAPWVADPRYSTSLGNGANGANTLTATQMNVYGGMRMGGTSYYGLDLTTLTAPKLLFRMGPDMPAFTRIGQSWSKPVLASVRYNGQVIRVMFVGGGYDLCYEDPNFYLGTTTSVISGCNGTSKTAAAGNAVYMVSAKAQGSLAAGQLIWEATAPSTLSGLPSGAVSNTNSAMVNSVVGRVAAIDRDGDGLVDQIYFADLGGQLFRADFNNKSQLSSGNTNLFANLTLLASFNKTSASATIANGNGPRFYEAPVLSYFTQGGKNYMWVGVVSGDRSSPIDVLPTNQGGAGLTTGRNVNNVYGIIDQDALSATLFLPAATWKSNALQTTNLTLANLIKNPQVAAAAQTSTNTVSQLFFPVSTTNAGWYRSLSSNYLGSDLCTTGAKYCGGMKAFEPPLVLAGQLNVTVYDPQGTNVDPPSTCAPYIVGETDLETFCLPYGACTLSNGQYDSTSEAKMGALFATGATAIDASAVQGAGIRGLSLATKPVTSPANTCNISILSNTSTASANGHNCVQTLTATKWYEKLPNPARVN